MHTNEIEQIAESYINGNISWTKEQIKRMTKQDFLYFIKVLVSTYGKSLNDINIILDC